MSAPSEETRGELGRLATLAWPIVLSHLGTHMLHLVDMAVVGRLGVVEFGAVGLGNSLYFGLAVMGLGVMLGFDPLMSQAVGAGETSRVRHAFWQSQWLALLVTVPSIVVVLLAAFSLSEASFDGQTAEATTAYMIARAPSLAPFFLVIGTRTFLQATNVTRPYLVSAIAANAVNFPLVWLLVFGDEALGKVGLPPVGFDGLGVVGAGLAGSVAVWVQLAVIWRAAAAQGVGDVATRRPDRAMLRAALRLGWPVGTMLVAEVGVFALASVAAGWLGPEPLAIHHVALTLASTTFQVPLGIGIAASVRVGQSIGAGSPEGARRAGWLALAASSVLMTVFAAVFVLYPEGTAALVTDQSSVIRASAAPLFVAAVFQLFDGAQTVMSGALRGAGDTRFPMLANLGGHYVVGLPVALWLAFGAGLGVVGLWWGLCAGLASVGVLLTWRFHSLSRGALTRVHSDAA